jgi:hydroxypyruvate reductase
MVRSSAREAARAIWEAALAAADVRPLVRRAVRPVASSVFQVGAERLDLGRASRVIVVGCGKASGAMAAALEDVLGDRVDDGFVVVKDGYRVATRRIATVEAGHPVPDPRGEAAARALVERVREAGPDGVVFVLISGGGSALTPAPASPVTLEEKRTITRLLLAAGASITELNAVRKHLSLFKGGQLARAAAPARVVTLVLSDVIGDPLDVIASGPTAPDFSTFGDAIEVLRRRGVWDAAPAAVRTRLEAGARGEVEETPKPGDELFTRVSHHVIGNNALVTDAAVARAAELGYRPTLLTRALEGEAREVARDLVGRARARRAPACLVAAGETTVTVRGRGRGGRCQELALAAALVIDGVADVTVLAGGTDGTDGPTDAAGGLVDGATVARARAAGVDARGALEDNDAHAALAASHDLLVSGPTCTNLLDLYLVLHGACPADGRTALNS